jgi:hypothetical protein
MFLPRGSETVIDRGWYARAIPAEQGLRRMFRKGTMTPVFVDLAAALSPGSNYDSSLV